MFELDAWKKNWLVLVPALALYLWLIFHLAWNELRLNKRRARQRAILKCSVPRSGSDEFDTDTDAPRLRTQSGGSYGTIVDRFNLQSLLEDPKISAKLEQAGYRGAMPLAVYYLFRMLLPIGLGLFSAVVLIGAAPFSLTFQAQLLIVIVMICFGFYAPSRFVARLARMRQAAILRDFPDTLDMMLICVESGMSIESALLKVSSEIEKSAPELSEELKLTRAELSYLPMKRLAYGNLSRRTGDQESIKAVAMALIQAERYGTSVGTALRNIASEAREIRMTYAEQRATALPAKLTIPMIVCFIPALFIVLLGPAYIKVTANQ